jgi:UBX domain-containing protein 1
LVFIYSFSCYLEGKGKSEKVNESYTGGEKSGMAVENPDDIEGVLKKAKENSEKYKDDDDRKKPETEIKISVYQNGFVVADGDFRPYDTPENKEFMKELNEGYVPKELRAKHSKPVGVALEDRRKEKFIPPPPPAYVAYQGSGTSMG